MPVIQDKRHKSHIGTPRLQTCTINLCKPLLSNQMIYENNLSTKSVSPLVLVYHQNVTNRDI